MFRIYIFPSTSPTPGAEQLLLIDITLYISHYYICSNTKFINKYLCSWHKE